MPDREKVIKSIECCVINHTRCFDDKDKLCPYFSTKVYMCYIELLKDALAMLKEQEAVEPHYNARTNWYECGNCHYSMTSGMHCRSELIPATKVRYCANCGFPVNWEGR